MKYYNGITMVTHCAVLSGDPPPRVGVDSGGEGSLRQYLPSHYHSVAESSHSSAYKGTGEYENYVLRTVPHAWCENGDSYAGGVARYTPLDCCGLKELVFTSTMGADNGGLQRYIGQPVDLVLDPLLPARIWLNLLFQRKGIMGTMSTAAVNCMEAECPDPAGEVIGKVGWLREYKAWVKACAEAGVAPWDRDAVSRRLPSTGKSKQYEKMLTSKSVFALVSLFDWIEWKGLGKVKPMPAYQNKNSSNIIYPLFLYPTMSREANRAASRQVMEATYKELMPLLVPAHQGALEYWLDNGSIRQVSNRYDRNLRTKFQLSAEVNWVPETLVSPFLRRAAKFGGTLRVQKPFLR